MIKIDGYVIDAAVTEEPAYESEVTAYPVESSADITDHTRNLPPSLSIEFIVSDTPIGEVAKARVGSVVPTSEAKGFLLALRASRAPFTVECASGVFESMIFESLSFPRDGATGAALMGSATFKQIEIREVRRTVVGEKRKLGRRSARAVEGKVMWLCPAGTRERPGDDEFNANQGCRKVVSTNGVPTFADGTPMSIVDLDNLDAQLDDDDQFAMKFDPDSWNDANPEGQWVYSKPERGNVGAVSSKYPALPGATGQTAARGPFDIFDPTPEPALFDGFHYTRE